MWLFLAFVIVPIIEIGLFVTVGGAIGLLPTLAIVVITAVLGTQLMRHQGMMTLNRLQTAMAEGKNPADPMAQGAMILVAGILLLTPGFFTDAIGFLLLLPPVRVALIKWVSARVIARGTVFTTRSGAPRPSPHGQGDVIDADYTIIDGEDDDTPGESKPSGWTKH